MKLRRLVAMLAAASLLLLGVGSGNALARIPTELTLDSSVDVGGGYWVDSGRLLTRGFRCSARPVRLLGTRPNGSTVLLDWDLTSLPGNAWATRSTRTGFEDVKAKVRRTKRCKGDSVRVFPKPAP
jgi:hypothetical protein